VPLSRKKRSPEQWRCSGGFPQLQEPKPAHLIELKEREHEQKSTSEGMTWLITWGTIQVMLCPTTSACACPCPTHPRPCPLAKSKKAHPQPAARLGPSGCTQGPEEGAGQE